MDREAWWVAIYWVAQSQTRLQRLSMHAYIGEENGNPFQYSCLENPRDEGAWWSAIYGVSQSRTRLKQLSSSSSSSILYSYYKILTILSVLYSMSLELICFTHSHLYLLISYPFWSYNSILVPMIHSTHRLCPLFNLRLFLLFLSTPNPPQQFSKTYWGNNGWWVWTFIQWTCYYMPAIMPDIE